MPWWEEAVRQTDAGETASEHIAEKM